MKHLAIATTAILASFGAAALAGHIGWLASFVTLACAWVATLLALGPAAIRLPGAPPEPDSSALLRLISDAVPDAVVLFTELGEIRHANASARNLFFEGSAPEGQNFLKLVSQAPSALREVLLCDADGLFRLEVEGRQETYHVSRRLFEVQSDLHILLVVKHVTREVTKREVEVLKQAIRMVSHEANNSLAPVSSLVHSARLLLEGQAHDPRLPGVLETIGERAAHLRSFLDGYASLARLPKPHPASTSWRQPLEHARSLFPEVKISISPPREGWFDPIPVEQVLINLLKNAAESGSLVADVELNVTVLEDGTSEVRVSDRGSGFGPEALQNGLLPLFSTKEKGSGMGLALSREIVEAHGGGILLANRPDGGGEVRFTLPGPRATSPWANRSQLTLTRH